MERKIAEFWQRIDAMRPDGPIAAADLGQWALNLTQRDPGARILVADFRLVTSRMRSSRLDCGPRRTLGDEQP